MVDDVSIGLFVEENFPDVVCQQINNGLVWANNGIITAENVTNYNDKHNPIAWRNRQGERGIDIINMQTIVEVLNKANNVHAQSSDMQNYQKT